MTTTQITDLKVGEEDIDYLVEVDSEGLSIRNLSCDQMGIRDLLRSAGAPEVAQVLARPIGFAGLSDVRGFYAVTAGPATEESELQCELNCRWRVVAGFDRLGVALERIRAHLDSGQPVLIVPSELGLAYYPESAPPGHLAILGSLRDGVAHVYDDLEVLQLNGRPVPIEWKDFLKASQDQYVHWYHVERLAVQTEWIQVLTGLLDASVAAWTSAPGGNRGLAGLKSLGTWITNWNIDTFRDSDQLTSLFLSMRFEMTAAHHILEIAVRRTMTLADTQALAESLRQAWRCWNSVIAILVGWKAVGQVGGRTSLEAQFDRLYRAEEHVVDEMERCRTRVQCFEPS